MDNGLQYLFIYVFIVLTLNRPGFLQIGMDGSAPLCNFCLDSPTDLKFGMWIVRGKISRYGEKIRQKLSGSSSKC